MDDCVFCDIIAGKAESTIVSRNDHCVAMMDTRPVNAGHVLVVPIRHADGLLDLEPNLAQAMFAMAQQVADAVHRSGIRAEGITLLMDDGQAAGQEVFHVHLHVIPRFEDDGFGFKFPPSYGRYPSREELESRAVQIRRALTAGH